MKLKPLYKASLNGDKMLDIYRHCEGYSQCFIIVQTEKGKRFGAFRYKPFAREIGGLQDHSSFIFSLDHHAKGIAI